MEELMFRVRTFVYTMICFQCLLQLSIGNSFHRYLKLFSQLLALCICCNIFFSFLGIMDDGWEQADRIYEQWQKGWHEEELIIGKNEYLENQITKKSILVFEQQLAEFLQAEGMNNYELLELSWEDEKWELVIKEKQSGENEDFGEELKQIVCQKFAINEKQLEVNVR